MNLVFIVNIYILYINIFSDHFGPRHCAIETNLSPMAHENMTYGPKWLVKILDGAKFYPDCTEIKKCNLSVLIYHPNFKKLVSNCAKILQKEIKDMKIDRQKKKPRKPMTIYRSV